MKSLRLYFLGPLSILCFQITAQVDDLMKDKNIIWMAESFVDIITDPILTGKIDGVSNILITPLKYVNVAEEPVSEEFALQNWYWNDETKELEIWLWRMGPLRNITN